MHAADIKTQNNSSLPNEALQYFLSVNDSLCGRVSSCYATWCNRTCTQKQHQMSERCAGHSTIYAPTHKSFRAHAHTLLRAIALTLHKSRVVPQSVSQSFSQRHYPNNQPPCPNMLIHLLHPYSHGHWLLSAAALLFSPGCTHTCTRACQHFSEALLTNITFCIFKWGAYQITLQGLCMMWGVDFLSRKKWTALWFFQCPVRSL